MGTAYVPCNATVVRWFARRRGLADRARHRAAASRARSCCRRSRRCLVGPSGWRVAYLVFGVAICRRRSAAVAPVMRRDPESIGPASRRRPAPPPAARDGGRRAGRSRAACGRRAFWLLAATFTATWMPVFIPLVHLVPLRARPRPLRRCVGASVVSAVGAGAVLGPAGDGQRCPTASAARPRIAIGMVLQALGLRRLRGRPRPAGRCSPPPPSSATRTARSRRCSPPSSATSSAASTPGTLVGFLFMLGRARWPRGGRCVRRRHLRRDRQTTGWPSCVSAALNVASPLRPWPRSRCRPPRAGDVAASAP